MDQDGIEEANREDEGFYVRSGIVTVLRNAEVRSHIILHTFLKFTNARSWHHLCGFSRHHVGIKLQNYDWCP